MPTSHPQTPRRAPVDPAALPQSEERVESLNMRLYSFLDRSEGEAEAFISLSHPPWVEATSFPCPPGLCPRWGRELHRQRRIEARLSLHSCLSNVISGGLFVDNQLTFPWQSAHARVCLKFNTV